MSAQAGLTGKDVSILSRQVGLLNRLRDNGLVTSRWIHKDAAHPRRYYSITDQGSEHLAAFRAEWSAFAAAVDAVLRPGPSPAPKRHRTACHQEKQRNCPSNCALTCSKRCRMELTTPVAVLPVLPRRTRRQPGNGPADGASQGRLDHPHRGHPASHRIRRLADHEVAGLVQHPSTPALTRRKRLPGSKSAPRPDEVERLAKRAKRSIGRSSGGPVGDRAAVPATQAAIMP